jgi:hypothetical protein
MGSKSGRWDSKPSPTYWISGENQQISAAGAPKASPTIFPPVPADPDLRAIVEAWPTMPEPIKAGILAMVKAAKG